MGGKTDVVKGRIKEAAGALTGNDKLRERRKDRPGSREGQAGRPEGRRHGKESREKSDRAKARTYGKQACSRVVATTRGFCRSTY